MFALSFKCAIKLKHKPQTDTIHSCHLNICIIAFYFERNNFFFPINKISKKSACGKKPLLKFTGPLWMLYLTHRSYLIIYKKGFPFFLLIFLLDCLFYIISADAVFFIWIKKKQQKLH